MSYLDDVEKELRDMLGVDEATDEVAGYLNSTVAFVKTKLLESYKNGAQAARKQLYKAQQPKPKQKSQAADSRKA